MDTENPKVLIAADDPQALAMEAIFLAAGGWLVMATSNRAKVLHLVREQAPALVLLDLSSAEGNGSSVCRSLRQFSDVPVVIVSTRGADEEVARGLEAGADDYIIKPVSSDEFEARLKAVLRRQGYAVQFLPSGPSLMIS